MTDLQREWYAKAKASGFEDIETGSDGQGLLKTDKRIEPGRGDEYQASADYYRRAGVFLHHRARWEPGEREAWALHAGGVGMNEIARQVHRGNTWVHATLNRLRAEMIGGVGRAAKVPVPYRENARALWKWLEHQANVLSDEDLIAMAPTLLEVVKSTPKASSTRR